MRINLYLFRDDVAMNKEALRRPEQWNSVELEPSSEDDVQWQGYVRGTNSRPPRWLNTLQEVLAEDVTQRPETNLLTQSAGAVLLVESSSRLFGITFGTGHHAIDSIRIEPDFGLKVAANSVDPAKLNVAESRGFDKGMKSSISKLPIPNELFALGLSTTEDWIRRLGGKVADPEFALSATGADSLNLNVETFTLHSLRGLLATALSRFQSPQYRDHFPFLDYFRRVPNREPVIQDLDGMVLEEMRSRSNQIGFAAPDELQVTSPDYFHIYRKKGSRVTLTELTTESVYVAIDELNAWRNPLRTLYVTAVGGQGEIQEENAQLKRYVVANATLTTESGGGTTQTVRYALTAGAWFRVDDEFADRVDRFMSSVTDLTDHYNLPTWDSDWLERNEEGRYDEDRYNRYVARERKMRLLDRDLYKGDRGQRVEVCDLLTAQRDLICVKRLDGADKMGHLFQQGSLSADMMKDNRYRIKVHAALAEVDGELATNDPDSSWTFVYAIATHREGRLHELLSFFSKVALMAHVERIERLGFRVVIAKIPRTAPDISEPTESCD